MSKQASKDVKASSEQNSDFVLEAAQVKASPFTFDELESRKGHDVNFLDINVTLPLPGLRRKKDQLALRNGELSWLNYINFSVLFDQRKRQALATITNIDGRYWKEIPRREGDVWYTDPRVSADKQPESKHFGKPDPRIDPRKNHYAFGHLVRRMDPCWELPANAGEAMLAELDTFHLTNASPQVEGLNTGTWLRLEDKVLKDLTERLKVRAVVVAGPIFDTRPRIKVHGDMPVPISYFKIVGWRSEGQLMSVGWVQEQPENLLPALETVSLPFLGQEERLGLHKISEIQRLTGLDLQAFVDADTFELRQGLANGTIIRPEVTKSDDASLQTEGPANGLLLANFLPLDDAF